MVIFNGLAHTYEAKGKELWAGANQPGQAINYKKAAKNFDLAIQERLKTTSFYEEAGITEGREEHEKAIRYLKRYRDAA